MKTARSDPAPWKTLYQKAILELDPDELPARLKAARSSIVHRLHHENPEPPEAVRLTYSLEMLDKIQQLEKVNLPLAA